MTMGKGSDKLLAQASAEQAVLLAEFESAYPMAVFETFAHVWLLDSAESAFHFLGNAFGLTTSAIPATPIPRATIEAPVPPPRPGRRRSTLITEAIRLKAEGLNYAQICERLYPEWPDLSKKQQKRLMRNHRDAERQREKRSSTHL